MTCRTCTEAVHDLAAGLITPSECAALTDAHPDCGGY